MQVIKTLCFPLRLPVSCDSVLKKNNAEAQETGRGRYNPHWKFQICSPSINFSHAKSFRGGVLWPGLFDLAR